MKVGLLTSFISRSAGGIYDAMRWLARSMNAPPATVIEIFGLRDPHADDDLGGWGGLRTHICPVKGPMAFGYAPTMPQALLDAGLDLLHLHGLWMYPSVACNAWWKQTGRRHVISPHGMLDPWALRNSRWKKVIARAVYERKNLARAACLQAGSESEHRAIRQAGLNNPVFILPNGIHMPDDLDQPAKPPGWAASVEPGAKILLYLGRLHPKKGLDLLLDAWKQATGGTGEWRLVIAGVGAPEYEQSLRAKSEALQLRSVHFVGPQYHDDKVASYRAASALILPSYSEGLPMVVLDGWAYALPVLMTPECNLPAGFEQDAAIQVQTSVESIVAGLQSLFGLSDAQRQALGQRGRELAAKKFSWDVIAPQMLAVYAWALGGGDRPDCMLND